MAGRGRACCLISEVWFPARGYAIERILLAGGFDTKRSPFSRFVSQMEMRRATPPTSGRNVAEAAYVRATSTNADDTSLSIGAGCDDQKRYRSDSQAQGSKDHRNKQAVSRPSMQAKRREASRVG